MGDMEYFEHVVFHGREDYEALGTEAQDALKENIKLETVERCRSCKKGFLSRWGGILKCSDHTYMEETAIPPKTFKSSDRRSEKYLMWWAGAFKKHGYRCQECGATKGLAAHHVKSFLQHPNDRFDIENSQILCSICHGTKHHALRTAETEYNEKMHRALHVIYN